MRNVKLSLTMKNLILRILYFLIFIFVGNLAFLFRQETFDLTIFLSFNLILIGTFLILNIIDWLIMALSKQKITKFSKWIFTNKLLSKQKTKNDIICKQVKYLTNKKNWFFWPFWAPIIVIPNLIMMFYLPLLVFSIISLLTTTFNLIFSLIIFQITTIFTTIIINLWSKNLNDGMKLNNNTWFKIEQEINKTKIYHKYKNFSKKSLKSWSFKIIFKIFSLSVFVLSLLTLVVGTKTFFNDTKYSINQLPYFEQWTLNIFLIDNWKNGLFVYLWGCFFWVWFINLWSFIKTEWYLLIIWRKYYIWFNILTLNFIILFLWSIRFNNEEKTTLVLKEFDKKNDEDFDDENFATTTSIINQTKNLKNTPKDNNKEQIITRVLPLDFDEEK